MVCTCHNSANATCHAILQNNFTKDNGYIYLTSEIRTINYYTTHTDKLFNLQR